MHRRGAPRCVKGWKRTTRKEERRCDASSPALDPGDASESSGVNQVQSEGGSLSIFLPFSFSLSFPFPCPLSLHFPVFCFFTFSFSRWLQLCFSFAHPYFLSTRIVPLRFQAGGRRKRPNLGLVRCVYFVLVLCLPSVLWHTVGWVIWPVKTRPRYDL